MSEYVYYWPFADMILIKQEDEFRRVWQCDDANFYWSDILDHVHEFVFLGEL